MSDWLLLATVGVFVAVCAAGYTPLRMRLHPLALILIAGAALIPPTYTARHFPNPDIDNFRRTGELVLSHQYVYGVDFGLIQFHPYLPLQMFVCAAAAWIADHSELPFSMALKAPNVAIAALLGWLLMAAVRRLPDSATVTWFAPLAFVLNPAVVLLTAYYGQFDVVPTLFAFGAWYAIRCETGGRWLAVSSALLGLAILAKTWPVALLPLFVLRLDGDLRSRVLFIAGALALPAVAATAYVLALDGSWLDLRRSVFEYRGVNGLSGYSMILQQLPGSAADLRARHDWVEDYGRVISLCGVLSVIGIALAARVKLERAITLTLVAFYVFAPAGTPSYFVWLLPFALIAGERLFPAIYGLTAVASRCSVLCYDHIWKFTPDWWAERSWYLGAAMWAVMVIWLLWLLGGVARELYEDRAAPEDERRPHQGAAAADA